MGSFEVIWIPLLLAVFPVGYFMFIVTWRPLEVLGVYKIKMTVEAKFPA